jgi:hypothetical protein
VAFGTDDGSEAEAPGGAVACPGNGNFSAGDFLSLANFEQASESDVPTQGLGGLGLD